MAFIDCAAFNQKLSVTVDDGGDCIRVRIGSEDQVGMTAAEAVKLRDDLSRAILEAATAAAKAVQAEGAQA